MTGADVMTGLVLETSASCQLHCPHCSLRSFDERPDPDVMPVEVVRAVAPYLAGLSSVDLTGWGEPFRNPDLFRLIEAVRENFSGRLTMTTNGLLLDADRIRRLIEFGLDTVCVSMDAASERGYEKARPGGSFARLKEVIEEFVSIRDEMGASHPLLFGAFLLRRDAIREIPDFVAMAAAHGLDGVILQQLTGVFSERGLAQVTHNSYYGACFDERDLNELIRQAREIAPPGLVMAGPERVGQERLGGCGSFDVSRPFVTASGQVSACCAMAYPCAMIRRDGRLEKTEAFAFGDVRETPLPEIWSDAAFARTRAEIRSGQVPARCGDCIALYMSPGEVWTAGE